MAVFLESVPAHLERDVDIFVIQDIFAGRLTVNPLKGDRWNVWESDYLKNFAS